MTFIVVHVTSVPQIEWKCWRVVLSWYSSASSRVRVGSELCDPFPIARGVKQGSVLSPILFLIVVDSLLRSLKDKNAGLSVLGSFVGGAAHADDLRTTAPSKSTIIDQVNIIEDFTACSHLNLNSAKTDIIKVSYCHPDPDEICSLFPLQRKLSVWVFGGTITSLLYVLFRRTSPRPGRPSLPLVKSRLFRAF